MKKVRKFYFLIITMLCYFCVMISVDATATCTYGWEENGKYISILELKINGYDDYTMSFVSAIYDNSIDLEKCTGNCDITATGGHRVHYFGELKEEAPVFSDEWLVGGGEFESVRTYTFNLYASQSAYSIVGKYDICPNTLYVYKTEQFNTILKTTFGGEDNDIYYGYFFYKDDLTKIKNSPGNEWYSFVTDFWSNVEVEEEEEMYLLDCSSGVCERKENAHTWDTKCETYNDYMTVLEFLKNENGGSCENSEKFTEAYRELVELCNKYSSSTNYTDEEGENVKNCMSACSGLKDDVADLCDYSNEQSSKHQCRTFGERTLAWIFKIINMIRYLIPVVLIILGILDFIKTIAADDDGEIKKVGTRFVKRLIAAALIFIVPLILQFVLNIFNIPGLDPNNPFCVLFIKF